MLNGSRAAVTLLAELLDDLETMFRRVGADRGTLTGNRHRESVRIRYRGF